MMTVKLTYPPALRGAVLTVCTLLAGCAALSPSPPTTFYTLSPIERTAAGVSAQSGSGISVGVGPAVFPLYLDRSQIVTREGNARLNVDEFQRWGGSLRGDFLRILAENLSVLLVSDAVAVYPWDEPFDPRYRVTLEVRQFEGRLGGDVVLNVRWGVSGRSRSRQVAGGQSIIRRQTSGADYEALVAAHSEALAELSRELAGTLSCLGSR